MEEIWKDVVGYEGDYMVSSYGRVKTIKFGRNKILGCGVDNLRLCTAKQNQNYELARSNKIHVHTKLEGKSILQFTTDGNFVREWDSISRASRELGYTREGIRDCCRSKQNTAFGFIWKYKEDMA